MIGEKVSHYRITRELGAGGMGVVYEAIDTRLDRTVALKFLPPELTRDPDAKARFVHEAKAAAALAHPNICTIHEADEFEGRSFIAMECCEGETLKERIARGPLKLEETLDTALQITEGLVKAHEREIVHRDIKPANIFNTNDGLVKILDFGLAKLAHQTLLTKTGTTLGTAGYMSPEQARGEGADHRTDLWSLGVVLYEMVTGLRPFLADHEQAIIYAILNRDPDPVTELGADVPPEVAQLIQKCLAKEPGDRYQSAAELRDRLQEIQMTLISGMPPGGQASLAAVLRRPRIMIPLTVSILVLAGIGGWWGYRAQKIRWAREEALPAMEEILENNVSFSSLGYWEAFQLEREARRYIPDDPQLARLHDQFIYSLTIHSDPPGARVYAKPYAGVDLPWDDLGTTPIDTLPYIAGYVRWKLELAGYRETEDISWVGDMNFLLHGEGALPGEMVWVPKPLKQARRLFLPGIEHVAPQELGDFLIDRYEVTNREFQDFVDAGGYDDSRFWKEPFRDGERVLDWNEAMTRFQDRTGRTGPATWEAGSFSAGQGDYPVSGISWFEAMAFAEFAGKSLPTIYHWERVALPRASSEIIPFSNLAGTGVLPTGGTRAPNRFGTYDLSGNVREWCANPDNRGGRFVLGGGWNDPLYGFNDAFAQSPWDRSETNGLRCIRYVDTSVKDEVLTGMIELPVRDFAQEATVSDETFQLFLNQFRYDPMPLNAVLEDTFEDEFYFRETVVYDAAYGGESIRAYLFLPKNTEPPYQTVIFFPGSNGFHEGSSEGMGLRRSDFIPKSGRAFLFPIYKSTYERGDGMTSDIPDETNNWKEHIIMWGKDLRRSVDYLESRGDIDADRLAYLGQSWGAAMGPIMMAIEPRFKAGIVVVAGLNFQKALPEVDQVHYIQRVEIPVLMLNGRYDFFFPYETSQLPFFELLKTPAEHKKLVVTDAGHFIHRTEYARETLAWLDKYLGAVR